MSWSINLHGEAQKVCDFLDSCSAYPNEGPESQAQINSAKKIIREEISAMVSAEVAKAVHSQHPSDKGAPPQKIVPVFVKVDASGHHDALGYRSFRVEVCRLALLI